MLLNLFLKLFSRKLTELDKRVLQLEKYELERQLDKDSKKYLQYKDDRN